MKLTKEKLTEEFKTADLFVVGWKSKNGELGYYERGGSIPVTLLMECMIKKSIIELDKKLKELS